MIENVGIDIVDNERFRVYLENEAWRKRILSKDELLQYATFTSEERKLTYICGRFCAKEAFIKAVNQEKLHFNYADISILNDDRGVPHLETTFSVIGKVHLSISHSNLNTTAIVIYEK